MPGRTFACLYMASPSFIEACASALVLAWMAAESSPLSASLRSAMAFSIAVRSASPTFEPCSARYSARAHEFGDGGQQVDGKNEQVNHRYRR
jgi:hypothetical protein